LRHILKYKPEAVLLLHMLCNLIDETLATRVNLRVD